MLKMSAIVKIWGEQSLMTALFRNDVENTETACSTKTSNRLFFVYAVGTKEFANACIHKHLTRPSPEVERRNSRNTLRAGTFAKIGEAG